MEKLTINGEVYIKKPSITNDLQTAISAEGLKYVIVRTYSAGVFAGYLKERVNREVTLLNARRLWYWSGASSLSELAVHGIADPDGCKFPCEVSVVELLEAIEILEVTEKARLKIAEVPEWKQR